MTPQKTQLEDKIRKIITFYGDDGTSGYLLSDEKIRELLLLFKKEMRKMIGKNEVFALRKDNPQYSIGQTNGSFIVKEKLRNKLKEV